MKTVGATSIAGVLHAAVVRKCGILSPILCPQKESNLQPTEFKLRQNYPNPFNAETVIPLELPQRSHVRVELFNLRGQSLGIIHEANENAGWPRIRFNSSGLASGMYFCRVTAEGLERGGRFTGVSKMLLLK